MTVRKGSLPKAMATTTTHRCTTYLRAAFAAAALLAGAILAPAAQAANLDAPMTFRTFEPCRGNGAVCATRILAQGRFEADTPAKFERFVAEYRKKNQYVPHWVVFHSTGGDLSGGLEMGSAIRRLRLDTELYRSYEFERLTPDRMSSEMVPIVKQAVCASACVFAFAGGINRFVEDGSLVGVHQFAGAGSDVGQSAAQQTVVGLAMYLESMGVSRELLDVASMVPAQSVRWLKSGEIRRFALDTTRPTLKPWQLTAGPGGQLILGVSQLVSAGKELNVNLVREAYDQYAMHIFGSFSRSHFEDKMVTDRFPVGVVPKLELCDARGCIKLKVIQAWGYTPLQDVHAYYTIALLTKAEADRLARATQLKFSDDQPMVTLDLWLSTDLSTEGLSNGLSSLMRSR